MNVQLDASNRVAYLFLTFHEHKDEPDMFGIKLRMLLLTRHDCDARPLRDGGDLHYDTTYALGRGQAWRCATCYREWSYVNGEFFEPSYVI